MFRLTEVMLVCDRSSRQAAERKSLFLAGEGGHAAELRLRSHRHDGNRSCLLCVEGLNCGWFLCFFTLTQQLGVNRIFPVSLLLFPRGSGLEHHLPQLADVCAAAVGLSHLDPACQVR